LSLYDISYCSGKMQYPSHQRTEPESAFVEYLEDAEGLVRDMADPAKQKDLSGWGPCATALEVELERLRWFPLPGEGSKG